MSEMIDEVLIIRPRDETVNRMAMESYLQKHGRLVEYEDEPVLSAFLTGEKPKVKHSCPESENHIKNVQESLDSAYGLVRAILLYEAGKAVAEGYAALESAQAELLIGLVEEGAETKKFRLSIMALRTFSDYYGEAFQKTAQLYGRLRAQGKRIQCSGKIGGSYVLDLDALLLSLDPKRSIGNWGSFGGSFSVDDFGFQWFVGQCPYKNPDDRLEGHDLFVSPVILDLRIACNPDDARYLRSKIGDFKQGKTLADAAAVEYRRAVPSDTRLS